MKNEYRQEDKLCPNCFRYLPNVDIYKLFPTKIHCNLFKIQHLGPPIVPIFSIHQMAHFDVLDPAAIKCAHS